MARCEDCIHYGVCAELERYRDPLWFTNTKDEFCCSSYLPADVVPRAEVERLQSQVNRLKKYDEERDIALHARLIANTRQEVAREIFGEIDLLFERFYNDPSYSSGDLGYDLADLKKKYAVEELTDATADT